MKRNLIILIATVFITLTVKGQNLFFIDEQSFPCTETITLQSNSDEWYLDNLKVLFAKDGKKALFVVSAKTVGDLVIRGKLIIYLDDGTVIALGDTEIYEYVNKVASAVYYLNNEELSKMKISNVNMVRYTLAKEDGSGHVYGGNFSASNKDIPTKDLIAKFFDNVIRVNEVTVKKEQEPNKKELDAMMGGLNNKQGQPNGDPFATSYYGSPGSGSGDGGYGLSGRSLVTKGKVQQECNQEGRVVVKIVVDRNGKVISATPGVKGTTNNNPCLLEPAKKTAFMHKWNLDSNAPSQQIGFVVVNYKLGE